MDMFRLVDGLGAPTGAERFANYLALMGCGRDALPALRAGLRNPSWQVRRWSAIAIDQVADEETLAALVPLLRDPHPRVRLWAVHSVACEHCKKDVACPVDVVPLLAERLREDDDLRVRRMAAIMLGSEFKDARAVPVLHEVRNGATDARLRAHAARALARLAAAGVSGAD